MNSPLSRADEPPPNPPPTDAPLVKQLGVPTGLQLAATMENVARIRVWVAMPTGGKEALEVLAGERVERLRDKVTSPTLLAAFSLLAN